MDNETILRNLLFMAQKSRSNIRENLGDDHVTDLIIDDLEPRLSEDDPLNLVKMITHTLSRTTENINVYNVLFIAKQSPSIQVMIALHISPEQQDWFEPMTYFKLASERDAPNHEAG